MQILQVPDYWPPLLISEVFLGSAKDLGCAQCPAANSQDLQKGVFTQPSINSDQYRTGSASSTAGGVSTSGILSSSMAAPR
jgi:hypothetical protein